ncbi:pyruvate, phosphate dikinase [Candidatus Solirubrobacter pratensis]|uniref:pyruvate, phosphate dikinase n=1 Tax=Candidatus Solirubrobacter pratensis TaxID=1298857 RepID=UPI000410E155|nr:pyruvate, phosphate dikinase [Candidatus Solirubrobacter pratensis]
MAGEQWVYDFSEGSKDMRELLGGKGANVAEMTRVLGADRVPAGFTITTEACVAYMRADKREPEGMAEQVESALERLQEQAGKRLGDDEDPLLVSVRSGARESMPGMLDTVLNLGLNDTSVQGIARATENERFAWDSYRRFVQMFGNVSRGIPGEAFEDAIKNAKGDRNVKDDTELDVEALKELTDTFKGIYREHTSEDFPQEPEEQLRLAIRAVFDSWMGKRAVEYRRLNHIPDSWGTAVNVQQMVFGNKGDTSGSGVAFSRDEVTGAPEPSGDFLPNAQGEDVVSGVRTPRDIAEMKDWLPEAHEQLMEILRTLESHYKDMQDTEFTVEEGQLYMLQTRNAKRPAQAAVRFAVDAVSEGLLTKEEAIATIDAGRLDALLHPTFDPTADYDVIAKGVSASPGAAKGEVVFTAQDAVDAAGEGRDVILVRPFTEADDVAGFHAAKGILTSEGGKASHAALVARGMGRPAVVGADALAIDLKARTISVNGTELHEGDRIAIDGTTGQVTTEDVPLVEAQVNEHFEQVLEWADEIRRLGVRTNADTPDDAAKARELGAEGIGLCRTEHMFMAEDRQPKMRAMIMAADEEGRREALADLLPLQQEDFEGLFEAMKGLPVTIRLLDPPLHEFLPNLVDLSAQVERARIECTDDLEQLERLLSRTEAISEENPMLGTRGCRLGILFPEIYEMQVQAIMRAAKAMDEPPHPEIMIPLVDYEQELEIMRDLVVRVGDGEGLHEGEDYTVGTMIELPRACFVADRIAEFADFFSFGTNDLTQTALGFSRDDVESKFVPTYMRRRIIDRSPFETIDKPGVGWLVRLAAWVGRERKPDLKLGICGEHGGDPDSIEFFHMAGLDYVSCSPFRVPIARVAAAQAAVIHAGDRDWAYTQA